MKVWSGTAWAEKPTKVWSGSAWVAKPVKVWSGSAWVTKPAAGAAVFADNFNRADGNLESAAASGGWSWSHDGAISGALVVNSNRLGCTTFDSVGSAYKSPDVASLNQYVQFKVLDTAAFTGPFACCRLADSQNYIGARVGLDDVGAGELEVYRRVGGAMTALSSGVGGLFSNNDIVRLEVSGTGVSGDAWRVYKNGTTLLASGTIGAAMTSTRQGLVARAAVVASWMDDYEAGGALMAAFFDFPASPVENQEYTPSGADFTYVYKAPRWLVKGMWAGAPLENGLYLDFTAGAAIIADSVGTTDYSGDVNGLLTYTAPSPKMVYDVAGVLKFAPHNLFLNSGTPANQTVAVISGMQYAITITGATTTTLSGATTGTIVAGTTTFTAATASLVFGSTSGAGTVQVSRSPIHSGYVATTAAVRYNIPLDYHPTSHAPLGVLIEEARTNLLLNSEALATQSATVTAAAHTLTFWGTGTITLSGVSTAGPLVGTGVNNRVSLTFTPTAGSLTLTVTGTVSRAQLEAGAFATSYIQTAASQVTRAKDDISLPLTSLPYNAAVGTAVVEAATFGTSNRYVLSFDNQTNTEVIQVYNGAGTPSLLIVDNSSVQTNFGDGSVPASTFSKIAVGWELNNCGLSRDGRTAVTDMVATMPTPTTLRLGMNEGSLGQMDGWIKRLTYYPVRKTNAELQTMSTP